MATRQLILPANRAFNSNGLAVPGAVARLYETGTTTPAAFYADDTLSVSLGSSITANGAGRFNLTAYQDADTAFRLIVEDPDGVELDDLDPFYFGAAYFSGVATDPGEDQPLSQVISGLQVIWTGGLNFSMSAGSYYVDGNVYNAEAQTLTLSAADGSNPRIDVLAVDTDGDFVAVAGTPAANPSEPDVDPGTQLKLKFVLVDTSATAPVIAADEVIYEEADGAGEWTPTTVGTAWATGSTSEPDSGTKCIAGTLVTLASSVTLNKGSTFNRDSYESLILRIKSKTALWGTGRLRLHLQNANGVRVGNIVSVEQGTFGFTESNVTSYQQVVIPLTAFAIPAGSLLQKLLITSSGGSFSCRIDNIKLQASTTAIGGTPPTGMSEETATALFAKRANNLSDLSSASTARTNLGVPYASAAEITTGTEAAKVVSPDALAGSAFGTASVTLLVSDPNGSAITTGDGKAYYRVPSLLNGMDLVAVAASLSTASSSGIPTVQIRNAAQTADMLTTKLTIDANETDSSSAANAAVIDAANDDVATGDQLFIDIDVAGTGAKGLIVQMQFRLP